MRLLPAVLAVAAYSTLVVLPAAAPFLSLLDAPNPGAGPLWDTEVHLPLLARSLLLAAVVTAAATLAAVPLALALYRTRLPFHSVWLGALLVPLLVPPYVLGTGVLQLLTPRVAVGFVGPAVTMTIWLLPLALLFAGTGVRLASRSQEEAALLETNPFGVWSRVTLPIALPHLGAAALFVFVAAIGEFGVPVLFQYRVYPGAIFAQFAAFYDFRQAALTSVPLLLVVTVAALAGQALIGREDQAEAIEEPSRIRLGATMPFVFAGIAVCAAGVVAPLLKACLGVGSLQALLRGWESIETQALRTFGTAAGGAAGAVLLALGLAWSAERVLPRSKWLVAAQIPLFAVPAVLVGLGIIRLWNEPDWRGAVYASPLVLVLGYSARLAPLLTSLLAASYRQIPSDLDEAGELDGANRLTVLRLIHIPLLRPALGAAGLLGFVLAMGEVPISMLIAPPEHTPLAVRFFTMITNAPTEQVAALAVLTTVLGLFPVMVWLALQRQRDRPIRSGELR